MRTAPTPLIITTNQILRQEYHSLQRGDIFIGRLRLKATEEHLLLDLVERGIILFPSALSQHLCRSKTFQAQLLGRHMLPLTAPIHDQHDMLETVNLYQKNGINRVVTKLDRKNAGMGIHLWRDVEDVFTHATLGSLPFPFVIQPFAENSRDIRVIILGDYIESYSRHNPSNFRNNLHCGGQSNPCELTGEQLNLCRQAMSRGKFPYAHIDLMIVESGETYLAEINLRGGIKGAKISPAEYSSRVDAIHRNFLSTR
jgi:glutathione synthase/RimK-type ligase-like ATP-grasp enzyme